MIGDAKRERRGGLESTGLEPAPRAGLRSAFERVLVRYAFGVGVGGGAVVLKKVFEPLTGTGAPFVLFFAAVVATSLWAGPGPGICATLLSSPLAAYTFVVRAGYAPAQAAFQAALFAADGEVVVYLSLLM